MIDIIQNVSSLNRGHSNLPKNHANSSIYKKLLRIDMQLGVSETEQLFSCLQFTFSNAYLKELVDPFIKNTSISEFIDFASFHSVEMKN